MTDKTGKSWIVAAGSLRRRKDCQPGWPSELYRITLKGKAALKLDQK
jgi:hypothetical protein